MKLTEEQVVEAVGTISLKQLRVWVSRGWIVPAQGEDGPVFDEMDVARTRLLCQLRQDMNVNEDAVPVVLSLLDQVYGLRREMRAMMEAICEQPEHVQMRIRDAYLARTERKFGSK